MLSNNTRAVSLGLVLILLVGTFGYVYTLQSQIQTISDEVMDLQLEVWNLEGKNSPVNSLNSTQSEIEIPVINYEDPEITPSDPIAVVLYESVKKSIVSIRTDKGSSGTGWVYDNNNHIITNYHVVQDAEFVEIMLSDKTLLQAQIVGEDIYSDLAILKIINSNTILTPIKIGDSNEIKVGEQVFAIGNPFTLSGSITSGIVSQKGRLFPSLAGYQISNMIQIDAAINPGNSGGPVLNTKGEVIGISSVGVAPGVGLAIPSHRINKVVPDLISIGDHEHPWFGLAGYNVNPAIANAMELDDVFGILIVNDADNSPASIAGFLVGQDTLRIGSNDFPIGGDVIISIDNIPTRNMDDLISYMDINKSPGDSVTFEIIRGGEVIDLNLTVGVRPPP